MNKKFNIDGFLTIKNFLSKSEKKDIIDVIYQTFSPHIEIANKRNFSIENDQFHKKLIFFRKKNPKKFGEIYDKLKLNAKLRSIFYKKKTLKIFSKILKNKIENIFLNGFMLRFDSPNDKRNNLDWHQDSSYYAMTYPKMNAGVCWMAITFNSTKNGTLQYIPKSNWKIEKKLRLTKKGKYTSAQNTIKITKNELKRKKNLIQSFGDASFLHMNLKHKSGINNSKKFRITLGCRFHDMDLDFNAGKEVYSYNKKV